MAREHGRTLNAAWIDSLQPEERHADAGYRWNKSSTRWLPKEHCYCLLATY